MKFDSVDQWGLQLQFWCTSNIHSWPERYRRSQYTPPSSWRQTMHSSWYMQKTRRRKRLKDLKIGMTSVTTTSDATFLSTMESTHECAMRLQASQPVSPPAIPTPPFRAASDFYEEETALPQLTYHCLIYVWWRSWAWFFWLVMICCFGVFFVFFCVVWYMMCDYYLWCANIISSKMMLQKFCERATQMYYEFRTNKNRAKRTKQVSDTDVLWVPN